ncbi:MAG: DUF58 domain-containing protein [Planctomycetales bacterium]|nr:DUF58 domain-containing protein [Planctomycetales bacterium]
MRFRLSREGIHFLGVLLFIFVGAVIREINLLLLLAGAMIGLLMLQWRFNTRTLRGLSIHHQLPRHVTAAQSIEVNCEITNPKRLLGAWLVSVEDGLRVIEPRGRKLTRRGTAVVDEIPPSGRAQAQYQLTFSRRGKYRLGPSTLSTRFPIGLGLGWRIIDTAQDIYVHPQRGELLPRASQLLYPEQEGSRKSSSSAGVHEAEFFGLRPWATGDSKRWIHWRTTARLGELAVRQFEKQQRQQICVLLDLYSEQTNNVDPMVELAISFAATMASEIAMQARDNLSISVAGRRLYTASHIQSPVLLGNLLDELAVVEPSQTPDLMGALHELSKPLLSNPFLIVVSTRPSKQTDLKELVGQPKRAQDRLMQRILTRLQVRWLNVSNGEVSGYWTPPTVESAI